VSPLATATQEPTVTSPFATPASAINLVAVGGDWFTWDVTALLRSWLSEEVPNYGLAIGAAPSPDAGVDEAGDLLAARFVSADDTETRPYIIIQAEIHPVTATPIGYSLLPAAGIEEPRAWFYGVGVIVLLGLVVLGIGLGLRRSDG
jgi:hypothetical protein